MKQTNTIVFFFFILSTTLGQNIKNDSIKSINVSIKNLLSNEKIDPTDKTCQQLFNDFYNCYESDEGQSNPIMISAVMNLYKLKKNPSTPNWPLSFLLYNYINSVSDPDYALVWISALKEEYYKVYEENHPLILLYEGESLINSGKKSQAHKHFIEFQKLYPKSITAMCYIYETETNKNLAKTWLSILKTEHPNHWIVKMYKEKED